MKKIISAMAFLMLLSSAAYAGTSSSRGTSSIVDFSNYTGDLGGCTVSATDITCPAFIPSGSTIPANGMYLPGTNILGFSSNTAERLRIDATGVVHINGSAVLGDNIAGTIDAAVAQSTAYSATAPNSTATLTINNTDTTAGNNVGFYMRSSTTGLTAGCVISMLPTASGSGSLRFNCRNAGTFADNMTILPGGAVGIGTINPTGSHLHVWGDSTTTADLNLGADDNVANYGISINSGRAMLGYDASNLVLNGGANKGIVGYVNGTNNTISSGTQAFAVTSTGFVGIGSGTPAAALHLNYGNISAAAWTTNGINFRTDAATYTDTSSSGTVAVHTANAFGKPTFAASSATTYTSAATLYVDGGPIPGSNVTISNGFSIYTTGTIGTTASLAASNLLSIGSVNTGNSTNNRVSIQGATTGTTSVTRGQMVNIEPSTITNPTSSGTIASYNSVAVGTPTFASSSAVTITDAASMYVANRPTAGSNTTITNGWAIYVAAGNSFFGGALNAPNLATSSAATTGTLCWTTSTGLINVDTTTTCLLSLEELKDKHGSITGALEIVSKLEPFWFTWKKTTPEWAGDKYMQPGLGAHQVESVDKRLVAYGTDGKLKGVRYQEMTAVLTSAVKELNQKVDKLAVSGDANIIAANDNVCSHFNWFGRIITGCH